VKLQRLLAAAGLFKGKQSGRLDRATILAVAAMQKTAGLHPDDGIPSNRTLLVLYRDYGREQWPRLSRQGGAKP